MTEYCEEADLIKIRPTILDLGVGDWSDQIAEAGIIIDRTIEVNWYRRIASENNIDWRVTIFDRDQLINASTQLKRAACYKTLELAFLYLMKHRMNDAFQKEREVFAALYKEEIHEVLLAGLDYDWNDDGLSFDETGISQVRRLVRV